MVGLTAREVVFLVGLTAREVAFLVGLTAREVAFLASTEREVAFFGAFTAREEAFFGALTAKEVLFLAAGDGSPTIDRNASLIASLCSAWIAIVPVSSTDVHSTSFPLYDNLVSDVRAPSMISWVSYFTFYALCASSETSSDARL